MHVVNLRLAMVYGAGGRGNLERMARLIRCGLFPPLPETGNHRSLVHVDDVVSVMRLRRMIQKPTVGRTLSPVMKHPPGVNCLMHCAERLGCARVLGLCQSLSLGW